MCSGRPRGSTANAGRACGQRVCAAQLLVAWHRPARRPSQRPEWALRLRRQRSQPSGKPIQWLASLTGTRQARSCAPAGAPTGMGIDHAGRLLVSGRTSTTGLLLILMSEAGTAPRLE